MTLNLGERLITDEQKEAINSIATSASVVLREEMEILLRKLTKDEIEQCSTCQGNIFPARLAKTLLLAVVETRALASQFGAETIKPNVKKLIRINKKRY